MAQHKKYSQEGGRQWTESLYSDELTLVLFNMNIQYTP